MRARNTPLTFEEKEEIRITYLYVRNQVKVAEITQHSPLTVSKVLIAYGINESRQEAASWRKKMSDEELSKCIDDGLTRSEIAQKYGMHVESVARRMKQLGKYACGDPLSGLRQNWGKSEYLNGSANLHNVWHYIESQDKKTKQEHPNFQYLETRQRRVRLRCKRCMNTIERSTSCLRSKRIECEYCKEEKILAAELKEKRTDLVRFLIALKESKTPKTCACCGEEFFSEHHSKVYCSEKCKKKAKRDRRKERDPEGYRLIKKKQKSEKKHIKRAKKYGCSYEYGITLKSVVNRDGLVCKICGKPCDFSDRSYGNGFGPLYPSVDHIIPLSKGGSHTWDNVQIAHCICNSVKRDLLTV